MIPCRSEFYYLCTCCLIVVFFVLESAPIKPLWGFYAPLHHISWSWFMSILIYILCVCINSFIKSNVCLLSDIMELDGTPSTKSSKKKNGLQTETEVKSFWGIELILLSAAEELLLLFNNSWTKCFLWRDAKRKTKQPCAENQTLIHIVTENDSVFPASSCGLNQLR